MPTVELVDIWKSFGKVNVLKGVNLKVEEGEFVVLLGPSGSGKTTLLRIIAGLEYQDKGHVIIGGRVVDDLTPRERNIAMVFQNYALYPHKTVYENIALPLRTARMKQDDIDKRVRDVAALLQIEGLLDRYPRQLSGGQQQRVALARALVRRPTVFLMDEPLSNLDAKVRVMARTFLKRLQKELNITTIYVTHDQAEAMALADRIAVISDGVIQQYDTAKGLYLTPANEFVAGFIGSPPINFIKTTIENGTIKLWNRSIALDLAASGDVVLGIRPEHINISDDGPFDGEVVVSEPLGSETIITIKVDGDEIKARIGQEIDISAGQKIRFGFSRALIFKDGSLLKPILLSPQPKAL